jgi:hypothetical protein
MAYVNDTEPSASTNTNDSESSADLTWSQATRAWSVATFPWSNSGASLTYDSKGAGTYINDSEPT